MNKTKVMYLNHSSVLIKYENEYLLCDPWYEKPAFGAWLPTFPLFTHPVYLASLKDKLSILISHGHDDHCDDHFLQLFDKSTSIISSDFSAPSVRNRVAKLGFTDYNAADHDGIKVGPFQIKSIRNDDLSEDDATYLIRTPDSLVIHCNDNWFPLDDRQEVFLKKAVNEAGIENTIYMSQTNSASGFPLNYSNFTREEKLNLLKEKVEKMIQTGLSNAHKVGAKYFHSYAGYASVFVKDKPEYLDDSMFPTPRFINKNLSHFIPEGMEVLDFYPGDVFDFESIQKSFFSSDIVDENIKDISTQFYSLYGQKEKCDSFDETTFDTSYGNEILEKKLVFFLEKLDEFVKRKTEKNGYYDSIFGKKLQIEVSEINLIKTLEFGKGIIDGDDFNKKVIATPLIIKKVLDGNILFENLYTGYNAEFMRKPADEYNKDIVMYIVMYSYVYKHRLASTFK